MIASYTLAVTCYAVAGLMLFAYFLWRRPWQLSLGVPFTIAGQAAQTGAIASEYFATGLSPTTNLYDSLSLFVAFTVLLFAIFARRYRLWYMGGFVVMIGDLFLAYAGTWNEGYRPLVPALQSYWLPIHVTTVVASYAAFLLAFCSSVLYLIKNYAARYYSQQGEGGAPIAMSPGLAPVLAGAVSAGPQAMVAWPDGSRWQAALRDETAWLTRAAAKGDAVAQWLGGIPPLAKLDVLTYRFIATGLPLLSLGIITGAMWARQAWGAYWQWDPKETASLVSWIVYIAYMHLHLRRQWRGLRCSWIAVIGFATIIFCYLGVNLWISGLHSYKS